MNEPNLARGIKPATEIEAVEIEPNLAKKAASLVSAVAHWAAKGFPIADEETVKSRLEICNSCPHWNPRGFGGTGKCTVCGCSTQAKLTMKTSVCPEGKW